MLTIARIYLGFTVVAFAGVGLAGLIMPGMLADQLGVAPKSVAGAAELRGLYGGAFIAWALMLVIAWRNVSLRGGLLVAVALSMGGIAVARLVSVVLDHDIAFNVPALIPEGLMAVACWALYRHDKQAA